MWGRLGLAAVALLATLGLLEVATRVVGYEPVADVYSAPSLFWVADELLGWSHEPGASGVYVGPRPYPVEFRTPVHINSLGLRGPELEPLAPGGRRVLVLGDSLVAAFEVPYEETFLALSERSLQQRLRRPIQLVNGGVRGYGTDQSLLYFRERGRDLAPDLVVMMHSFNDPSDNMTLHRMRRPFGKPAFALRKPGLLELVGHPVPDYPLCTARSLDAAFQPIRTDGALHRALCTLQTRLMDHSALFTFAVLRLQRIPGWMEFLHGAAGPGNAAGRPPRVRAASVLPLSAGPAPEQFGDVRAASYALSTELIRQLAREARTSGADFLLILGSKEIDRLDARALERDGIDWSFMELRGGPDFARSIRFRNDAHLNRRGHYLASKLFTGLLEERLGGAQ